MTDGIVTRTPHSMLVKVRTVEYKGSNDVKTVQTDSKTLRLVIIHVILVVYVFDPLKVRLRNTNTIFVFYSSSLHFLIN